MSLIKQYLVDDVNGEQLLVEGTSGVVTITDLSNGEQWQYTLEGADDLAEALDLAIIDASKDEDDEGWEPLGHTDAEDTLPGTFYVAPYTINVSNPTWATANSDQICRDIADHARLVGHFTD